MLKSQRPEERPEWTKWRYVKQPRPWKFRAILAGEPFGLITHFYFCTKPCVQKLTDGQVPCKHCELETRKEFQAYVPFYTFDNTWRVILIGEKEFSRIEGLPVGSAVEVNCPRQEKVSPKISTLAEHEVPQGFRAPKGTLPADLTPWLINLWRDNALSEWYARQPREEPSVSQPQPPSSDAPPAGVKRKREHHKRVPEIPQVFDEDESKKIREMLDANKLKLKRETELNGNHT